MTNSRQEIAKFLLKILNFLDRSPAIYARVNNIENYSREFLEQSAEMEPEITLKSFMEDMRKMGECMGGDGNYVIENGESRPMVEQDVIDLQEDFKRSQIISDIKKRQDELNK